MPLTSRTWTPHPEIPKGVPRANWPFLSPVPTSTTTKSHTQNLTSHWPSVPFGHGLGLSDTPEEGYFRHRQAWRGSRKSREEVPFVLGGSWDGMLGKREELWTRTVSKVASGKRALPTAEEKEQDSTGWQARRAPDADRVPEWPAGRDRWQRGIIVSLFRSSS